MARRTCCLLALFFCFGHATRCAVADPPKTDDAKIVEGVGWKAVRLGAKREDVINALGKPDGDSTSDWLKWKTRHIECTFYAGEVGVCEVRFNEGFPESLANGIKPGSMASDMSKVYGHPENAKDWPDGSKNYVYSTKGILFNVREGKIIQITTFKPYSPVQRDVSGKWWIIERMGKGFVACEPQIGIDMPKLKMDLSEGERLENFEILWEAIDKHYSFFDQ